jgi:2'-hydroxyisoflavone reductase
MKVLVLGGTEFVGRAVVAEALRRGDDVTVLNRGTHEAPHGVRAVRGVRGTPEAFDGLTDDGWDVLVDTWSWEPVAVRDAARAFAGRVGTYAYVSSRSVYTYPPSPLLAEDGPLVESRADDGDADDYARTKRGGELAAVEAFGDHALLLRAGLILGPYENIGRLPWWLGRIARGGPVLAPGPRDLPLQYVDARDLAAWALDAAARGLGGAFNVVSPPGHTTMGELLETCRQVTGSDAELRWIDPEVILAAGVQPWMDLPIWLPPGEDHDGMHCGDVSKAVAAGLVCRPVLDTVTDTWAWLRDIGGSAPQRPDRPPVGLDPVVEAELLAAP